MSANGYSLGQIGDFEIKQLKVFKTVVECGGFSAAETVLNIGRSTISMHISNLEARLNLVLCKRGRAGFSLTDEGQIVYEMTENLFETLDGFRATVNNINTSLTGQLRLDLSDKVSLDPRSRFPEMVRHFHEQAPGVRLTTRVASMANIERAVLNDEADVGFIPYHRKLEGLEYIHLFVDQCYIYASSDHPLAALDVADQAVAVDHYPLTHAGLKPHDFARHQISGMNQSAVAYFYETRLALILSGCYIGFLPEYFAAPYVEKGQILPVATNSRVYDLGVAAIFRKTSQPNRSRELFIRTIRETLGLS